MNGIRDDFPKELNDFFKQLENYIDTELYFYGSVKRTDYVHNKSDIDVAVFTDNEYSMMAKLQHFLKVKQNAFDKVVWKLNGKMIYGYKINCEKYIDLKCEIAIYNNDFKDEIINEFDIPIKHKTLLTTLLLYLLKLFYYQIPLIPKNIYVELKRYVLNEMMVKKESVFLLLKQT
jgi:predicted nucleotidyltransferase